MRERLYGRLLDIDVFSDCVGSVTDALASLEESAYTLVIADVQLAEPIVNRIAHLELKARPIVLVLAPNADAARSLDVEIVQIVLRRPVNVPQLTELIASCVRSSAAPRGGRDVKAGSSERSDRAF